MAEHCPVRARRGERTPFLERALYSKEEGAGLGREEADKGPRDVRLPGLVEDVQELAEVDSGDVATERVERRQAR